MCCIHEVLFPNAYILLKPHLLKPQFDILSLFFNELSIIQTYMYYYVRTAILFSNLATFPHLWAHKLAIGPFHKCAAWPSLMFTSYQTFNFSLTFIKSLI